MASNPTKSPGTAAKVVFFDYTKYTLSNLPTHVHMNITYKNTHVDQELTDHVSSEKEQDDPSVWAWALTCCLRVTRPS